MQPAPEPPGTYPWKIPTVLVYWSLPTTPDADPIFFRSVSIANGKARVHLPANSVMTMQRLSRSQHSRKSNLHDERLETTQIGRPNATRWHLDVAFEVERSG